MENKKVLTKEEAKELVADVVTAAKVFCALAEVEAPGNKQIVLDALIDELEELAGRKKLCTEGACSKQPTNENLDFGQAIRLLKDGHSMARRGWNGKNQFVELARGISYKGNAGEIVNAHHNDIGSKALAFIGTSGVQLGWLASQADMLAEDWYAVN